MTLWLVSIKERHADSDAWLSVFSTEEKADAFIAKAKGKLHEHNELSEFEITKDFGNIDDEMYLRWIDERYDD